MSGAAVGGGGIPVVLGGPLMGGGLGLPLPVMMTGGMMGGPGRGMVGMGGRGRGRGWPG